LCLFFLALRPLHSFPTRRSSDLAASLLRPRGPNCIFKVQFRSSYAIRWGVTGNAPHRKGRWLRIPVIVGRCGQLPVVLGSAPARSEEHTSELQSRVDLVCRLLLE